MLPEWKIKDQQKVLLYGALAEGSKKIGNPQLRYKNACKDVLRRGDALHKWRATVLNRVNGNV